MKKMGLAFAVVLLSIGCIACGGGPMQQSMLRNYQGNWVDVDMSLHLERAYIRANSSLGAGAVAMWVALGPFSRNVIRVYGDYIMTDEQGRETVVGTFNKQVEWGDNHIPLRVPANCQIMLRLRSGGTREGMVEMGRAYIGDGPQQQVIVWTDAGGVRIN